MPDAPAPDLCSDEAARYIELRNIAMSVSTLDSSNRACELIERTARCCLGFPANTSATCSAWEQQRAAGEASPAARIQATTCATRITANQPP